MARNYIYLITLVIALSMLLILLAVTNHPYTKKIDFSPAYLHSVISDQNFSLIANTTTSFSNGLNKLGYVYASDDVFSGKINSTDNGSIVAFTVIYASNLSLPMQMVNSELQLARVPKPYSGSYYNITRKLDYLYNGRNITLYQILDVGVFNKSEALASSSNGIPAMPYYQYTTFFSNGRYYGSATINTYNVSSSYSNASLRFAEALLSNYT